jgi:hypothetical protein
LDDLPDLLVRATALLTAGGEAAGKLAVVLPQNVGEMLAESKDVSSRVAVSPYEQMELEQMDVADERSASFGAREPSMENIDLILDIQQNA